jgi:hypothetical protein
MKLVFKLVGNLAHKCLQKGDHNNTIPKSREWMIVNCVVNAIGDVFPSFYIFKGERIREDYI